MTWNAEDSSFTKPDMLLRCQAFAQHPQHTYLPQHPQDPWHPKLPQYPYGANMLIWAPCGATAGIKWVQCGPCYRCEMWGTYGPQTVGRRWCPSGTAHTQPKVWAVPLGLIVGPQCAHSMPLNEAPPGPHSLGPTHAPHFTLVTGPTVGSFFCPQWPHMGPKAACMLGSPLKTDSYSIIT